MIKALKLSKRLRKDKHRIKSKLLKNKKSSGKLFEKLYFNFFFIVVFSFR